MADRAILALNCGSSSLKFGVFSEGMLLLEGEAEEVGRSTATFWNKTADAEKQERKQSIPDHGAALQLALHAIREGGIPDVSAVGHRIVHGGPHVRDHVRLSNEVMQNLQAAVAFAPLHLPASLAVIEAVSQALTEVPQVICLDTAFHKNLPDVTKTLPFSKDVRSRGVERYGFHGLSLESILEHLNPVPEKLIVAHLGNGASVTAIRKGQSIDTTMGLTPSGGVMMGTRTGDVDPGVLIYLLSNGIAPDQLEKLVDHDAGLLGVSQVSSDVRELTEARTTDDRCDLALRMFGYQVRKAIGAMAAALGGLDSLIFAGGIGEHADQVRQDITSGLGFLGDFETRIIPAEEDLQIARITNRLIPTE